MKKLLLTLPLTMVAASLMAAPKPPTQHTPPKSSTQHTATKPMAAPARPMDLKAEVVSVDVKAGTLTYKSEGKTATLKVDSSASKELASLKPGQQISLAFRENSKGVREAISRITPASVAG